MLRLINRLANSRLVCFCVWLAFALWVWSILSDRGHKQLLIGGVVSIICGVLQVLRSILKGGRREPSADALIRR